MSENPHESERECGRIVNAIADAKAVFMTTNRDRSLADFKATLHLGHVQRWAIKATREYASANLNIEMPDQTFMGLPVVFVDRDDCIEVTLS